MNRGDPLYYTNTVLEAMACKKILTFLPDSKHENMQYMLPLVRRRVVLGLLLFVQESYDYWLLFVMSYSPKKHVYLVPVSSLRQAWLLFWRTCLPQ